MKASKKILKNLFVEVNNIGGFTLWVLEDSYVDGKKITSKHWVLDGSCVKNHGEINLGNPDFWDINAVFDKKTNSIKIIKKHGKANRI